MGHSQTERTKSRERILDVTARRIRQGRFGSISIAEITTAANLTHGGFSSHVPSATTAEAAWL